MTCAFFDNSFLNCNSFWVTGYLLPVFCSYYNLNKTGLQPVSRPVEQILGFFQKVFKRDHYPKVSKT